MYRARKYLSIVDTSVAIIPEARIRSSNIDCYQTVLTSRYNIKMMVLLQGKYLSPTWIIGTKANSGYAMAQAHKCSYHPAAAIGCGITAIVWNAWEAKKTMSHCIFHNKIYSTIIVMSQISQWNVFWRLQDYRPLSSQCKHRANDCWCWARICVKFVQNSRSCAMTLNWQFHLILIIVWHRLYCQVYQRSIL